MSAWSCSVIKTPHPTLVRPSLLLCRIYTRFAYCFSSCVCTLARCNPPDRSVSLTASVCMTQLSHVPLMMCWASIVSERLPNFLQSLFFHLSAHPRATWAALYQTLFVLASGPGIGTIVKMQRKVVLSRFLFLIRSPLLFVFSCLLPSRMLHLPILKKPHSIFSLFFSVLSPFSFPRLPAHFYFLISSIYPSGRPWYYLGLHSVSATFGACRGTPIKSAAGIKRHSERSTHGGTKPRRGHRGQTETRSQAKTERQSTQWWERRMFERSLRSLKVA